MDFRYLTLFFLLLFSIPISYTHADTCPIDTLASSTVAVQLAVDFRDSYQFYISDNDPYSMGVYYDVGNEDCSFSALTLELYGNATSSDDLPPVHVDIYEVNSSTTDPTQLIATSDTQYFSTTTVYEQIKFNFDSLITLKWAKQYIILLDVAPSQRIYDEATMTINWISTNKSPGYTDTFLGHTYEREWNIFNFADRHEHDYISSYVPKIQFDETNNDVSEFSYIETDEPMFTTSLTSSWSEYSTTTINEFIDLEGNLYVSLLDLVNYEYVYIKTEIIDITGNVRDSVQFAYEIDQNATTSMSIPFSTMLSTGATTTDTNRRLLYEIRTCFGFNSSEMLFGGGECANGYYGNGVTESEFEDLMELYGDGLQESAVGDNYLGLMSSFYSWIRNDVLYVFPWGYATHIYDEWASSSENHSSSSKFAISLDMSEFGLPTTSAQLNITDMANEAETLSPTLIETVETVLYAFFGIYLVYRLWTGAWYTGVETMGVSTLKANTIRRKKTAVINRPYRRPINLP